MGKNTEITNWNQLKNKPKIGKVSLQFPDGDSVDVKIQGLSQSIIDKINEKYDAMKPAQPMKPIKDKNESKPRWIPAVDGSEYEDYQKKIKQLDSLKFAETALAFLIVKPEGTLEEQLKQLSEDLLAGHFIQIIQAGYEVSGFDLDERIKESKNS